MDGCEVDWIQHFAWCTESEERKFITTPRSCVFARMIVVPHLRLYLMRTIPVSLISTMCWSDHLFVVR